MIKIIFSFLIILNATAFASQTSPPQKLLGAQSFTLTNGLQVIVVPNKLSPTVTMGILYKVGCADDPIGQTGLSHFLEHMMFKGSKQFQEKELDKFVARVGGDHNAKTSYDFTLYYASIPAQYLELLMRMEADRMKNLTFTHDEVESERQVVMEERRQRFENNPMGQMHEVLIRMFHWYHPYGVINIGTPADIAAYTYDSIRSHYEKWYRPDNAVLIVLGDANLEHVKMLAEKHFGGISKTSNPLPKRERPQNPSRQNIKSVISQENPRVKNINVSWYYDAPHFKSFENKKMYFAILMLAQVMGKHTFTKMYAHFVKEKKLCLGISAQYEGDYLDPQHFTISAVLPENGDTQKLHQELQEWINALTTTGIDADDLKHVRDAFKADLLFLKDGNKFMDIFTMLASGFSLEDIENYPEMIESITPEDVKNAAQLIFAKPVVLETNVYPKCEIKS